VYKILLLMMLISCTLNSEEYFLTYIKGEYQIIGSTNLFAISVQGNFLSNGLTFMTLNQIKSSNYAIYKNTLDQFSPILFFTNIIYIGGNNPSIELINTNNLVPYANKL